MSEIVELIGTEKYISPQTKRRCLILYFLNVYGDRLGEMFPMEGRDLLGTPLALRLIEAGRCMTPRLELGDLLGLEIVEPFDAIRRIWEIDGRTAEVVMTYTDDGPRIARWLSAATITDAILAEVEEDPDPRTPLNLRGKLRTVIDSEWARNSKEHAMFVNALASLEEFLADRPNADEVDVRRFLAKSTRRTIQIRFKEGISGKL